jgi:hypothetical protein
MTQAPQLPQSQTARPRQGVRRIRVGAAIAVALAVAFAAWLIFRDGDDKSSEPGPASSAASVAQLRALPTETGHDIYWVGRRQGYTYELTRTVDGNVYIRYLPPGVPVGDGQPAYLTIGTYPRSNALNGLRRLARRRGNVSFAVEGGGLAVYSRGRPNSVYVAHPGDPVQVEVYDPSAQRARGLARDGQVRPVG